ncbi:hypothetical protein [Sphingomonas sp.]|uniref:hypothetical protein n=1 Tax=Sphingomonas sp. TaxID=28214 RepID=UPI0035BC6C2D
MPLTAPLTDPRWLAHRYDAQADAVHFVSADRAARSSATFLTDEFLPGAAEPIVIPRSDALPQAASGNAVHFIFHSAYCCSTLLARVLDRPGVASTLKEPVILNDLVGWRHRGGAPARIGEVLDSTLHLLTRPFEAGEATIIKPSNVVNALAPAMLALRPDAKAVLLYAPLRVFLTSIARKGMWGRLWVRDLLTKQLADGMVDLGFEPTDYLRLTDIQAAAVGWIAQADLFARLVGQFPERVRTLNSETLLAEPAVAVAALTALYKLPLMARDVEAIARGGEFARNAKDGSAYAATDRVREQDDGAKLHADEVDKVVVWAEAVAVNAGVALEPSAPLLG